MHAPLCWHVSASIATVSFSVVTYSVRPMRMGPDWKLTSTSRSYTQSCFRPATFVVLICLNGAYRSEDNRRFYDGQSETDASAPAANTTAAKASAPNTPRMLARSTHKCRRMFSPSRQT